MKKTLITLSFVCAGALAFADEEQFNSSWFSGIGTGATSIEALGASNGTWSGLTADNASVANGALVLDLDAGVAEEATFKVADTAKEEAKDAFPVQGIVVRGVFTPIAAEALLTGKAMAAKNAKVGFAIVNVGNETDSYKYYAWVGGGSAAETESASAITDWVDLGTANDVTTAKTIVIGLDYSEESVVTAEFAVGEGNLSDLKQATSLTQNEGVPLKDLALSKAMNDKVIASASCTGSGTLSALQGIYQYAVAEAEGRKFGTAVEAIAAAQATGGSGNVILRRDVNGKVSVSGGLRLHYDTSVSGRNQNIQENFKIAESSAQTKVTSNAGSPLIEGWGYKEWALPNDVLLNVKINDRQIGSQTGIFAGDFNSKFTDWLMNNCSASRESAATATTVQEALTGTTGKNGYLLWQSYVMGVDADKAVKLAPATTDAEGGIALTLTSTIPDSPFASAIKYTVYKDGASVGEAMSIGTRTSPVVKIPLATGKYSVSFTIE